MRDKILNDSGSLTNGGICAVCLLSRDESRVVFKNRQLSLIRSTEGLTTFTCLLFDIAHSLLGPSIVRMMKKNLFSFVRRMKISHIDQMIMSFQEMCRII